jgi:hypothetical protein
MKDFATFFCCQFLLYFIICWNYRVIAKGWVGQTVVSDLLFAAVNFTVIKKVAAAKGRLAMVGYVCGGAAGSASSVYLTKTLWGA